MDFIKQLTRNVFHYFSNETSTSSKKKRIESKATLKEVIRGSNFYLLAFLKPQSVIELLTVNKGLHTLLSDEVINRYGKQLADSRYWYNAFGSMIPAFTNYNLSYREFFVRQLRMSPRVPKNYKIRGNFHFHYEKDNEFLNHVVIVDGSNYRKILLPVDKFPASDIDLAFLVQDACIILEPIFQPTWLRDTGPLYFWYGETCESAAMERWNPNNPVDLYIENHHIPGQNLMFRFNESGGGIELSVHIWIPRENNQRLVHLLPYRWEIHEQEKVECIEKFFKLK